MYFWKILSSSTVEYKIIKVYDRYKGFSSGAVQTKTFLIKNQTTLTRFVYYWIRAFKTQSIFQCTSQSSLFDLQTSRTEFSPNPAEDRPKALLF